MDKIKEAQTLVDQLLDECSCQPDLSGKDQNKVAQQKDTLFDNPERMVKDKTDEEAHLNPEPVAEASKGAIIQRGIKRNDMHLSLGYAMDPKAKKNAEKRKDDKSKTTNENDAVVEGLTDWIKKKARQTVTGKKISKRQQAMKDVMNS